MRRLGSQRQSAVAAHLTGIVDASGSNGSACNSGRQPRPTSTTPSKPRSSIRIFAERYAAKRRTGTSVTHKPGARFAADVDPALSPGCSQLFVWWLDCQAEVAGACHEGTDDGVAHVIA